MTPATTGEIFSRLRGGSGAQGGPASYGHQGYQGQPGVPGGRQPGIPPRPPRRYVDYPRWGRDGWRRWVPSWRLVAGIAGLGFLTCVVAFVTAYASTTIPTPDSLVEAQTTVISYRDGGEMARLAEQDRRKVELAQVPPHLQKAILAAEDRSFYENNGVNPTSILRAAWANVRGGQLQGGSTITQQYVKNYFDLRDRTVSRKAKEFFIALKIDRELDKDTILRDYLNAIYFGRGAYGVEAASQAYFGKSVSKLNVSEAAYLAGIVNSPVNYDPADGQDSITKAQRRWNYVLDGMVEEGWLSPQDRAAAVWPAFVPERKNSTNYAGQTGYLVRMAELEAMKRLRISEDDLRTGGYQIQTTFNRGMVKQASQAVKEMLPKKRPAGLQVAIVTIDPRDGQVLSIYGGENYLVRQQNAVTQDRAQAGSTFKPFGLVAALENEIELTDTYSGRSPMRFADGKARVDNFDDESFGQIDLMKATASSVNTVYVQLNEEVGPEKTKDVALRAGIPDDKATNVQGNLVNVLGSASPHPIDMAAAYGTFANQGMRNDPTVIAEIKEIGTGKSVYKRKASPEKAFEKDVMADATYALQQVVERGSGQYAQRLDRPAAGKTGTSQDNKSAWFVGFTPNLVTAVAMYQNDANGNPVPMKGFGEFRSITGGSYPVRIWTDFMERALGDSEVREFPEPTFEEEVSEPEPTRDEEEERPTATADPTQDPEPSETGDGSGDEQPTEPSVPPTQEEGGFFPTAPPDEEQDGATGDG